MRWSVGTIEGSGSTTIRWENQPTTSHRRHTKKKSVNGSVYSYTQTVGGRLAIYLVYDNKGNNYGKILCENVYTHSQQRHNGTPLYVFSLKLHVINMGTGMNKHIK